MSHYRFQPWTMRQALSFIRRLEPKLAPCYHVALMGGMLHKKQPRKDLDIIIFPHTAVLEDRRFNASWKRVNEIRNLLSSCGLKLWFHHNDVREHWRHAKNRNDMKLVDIWVTEKLPRKRIDVFMLK